MFVIIAKYSDTNTCVARTELWSTNFIRHTNYQCTKSPFPQAIFVSSNSTMKMKSIFMVVLVCAAGLSYGDATITADIVSAAYDELESFLNANGKYIGRMVRLSKYIFDTITTSKI